MFLARFLFNSCYYPVFELLTEQEKMRVLKQREIQQFENNTRIFYSLIKFQKPDNNTNLTKTLPKTRKVLSHLTLPFIAN